MKITIDTTEIELVEKIIIALQEHGALSEAIAPDHNSLPDIDLGGIPVDQTIYPPRHGADNAIKKDSDGVIQFVTGNTECMEEENKDFVELLRDYENAKDEIDLLTKQRNRLTEDCVRLGMENKKLKDQKKDEIVIDRAKVEKWSNGHGFRIQWVSVGWGFGVLNIDTSGGRLIIETECMSKGFIQAVFAKLLEDAVYVNNYEDDN